VCESPEGTISKQGLPSPDLTHLILKAHTVWTLEQQTCCWTDSTAVMHEKAHQSGTLSAASSQLLTCPTVSKLAEAYSGYMDVSSSDGSQLIIVDDYQCTDECSWHCSAALAFA